MRWRAAKRGCAVEAEAERAVSGKAVRWRADGVGHVHTGAYPGAAIQRFLTKRRRDMRHTIPGHFITLDLEDLWLPQVLPVDCPSDVLHGFGQYFTHRPSGLQLNARNMSPLAQPSLDGLLKEFRAYGAVSWPSASVEIEHCTHGSRKVVMGSFVDDARPGETIREWFVNDGAYLANFAGPGNGITWEAALLACWRLVRSVQFLEKPNLETR
jgi:hypothetical protein